MEACKHQKENLVLYAHGELDATTGESVANHLATCEPCRIEWQQLRSLLAKLKGRNQIQVRVQIFGQFGFDPLQILGHLRDDFLL